MTPRPEAAALPTSGHSSSPRSRTRRVARPEGGAPVTQLVRFRLDDARRRGRRRPARPGGRRPAAPFRRIGPRSPRPRPSRSQPAARAALADELRVLALPTVWLATLGSTAGRPDELVLAAVVDTELLAVHTAVHDALAGRVRGPVAAYLPGAWLPHCVLASRRAGRRVRRAAPGGAGAGTDRGRRGRRCPYGREHRGPLTRSHRGHGAGTQVTTWVPALRPVCGGGRGGRPRRRRDQRRALWITAAAEQGGDPQVDD